MDQRRSSYGQVVCEFGKYVRNFEDFCSENPNNDDLKKTGKRKKTVRENPDKRLPAIAILKKYEGAMAKRIGIRRIEINLARP